MTCTQRSQTGDLLDLDVNKDGVINIEDLISVAFNYGKTVAGGANPNADVNNDGRVDILDLTAVAEAIDPSYAAPDRIRNTPDLPFTTEQVQQWIVEARAMGAKANAYRTADATFDGNNRSHT